MPNLLLIPTEGERERIESRLRWDPTRWTIETIGFGLISAGIETEGLLHQHRPGRVIVAGIAGLFDSASDPTRAIGSACWFDAVAVDGIGVGQGEQFVSAKDLGWRWAAGVETADRIECQMPAGEQPATLLSVCSGSADGEDAARRRTRFPDAVGEDMESYAVAYACRRQGVACEIVRGFSNIVGQRDRSVWRVTDALDSVVDALQHRIDRNTF